MWHELLLFAAVGFAAQLIDGAIGMAYGVTGTTVMLSLGVAPATASASIHAAEVFTCAASGLSHWRFGNIRWSLLWRLALPGMLGGAVGAYLLSVSPGEAVRPYVSGYLLVMGLWIVWKAFHRSPSRSDMPRWLMPLGLAGGFLDAVGGGGWGPTVASTLVGRGTTPRYVIGSVSAAEFFVTLVVSITFLGTIGLQLWPIITGLILGGIVAAPLGALATKKLPERPLMLLVGAVVILLSGRGLLQSLG